KTSTEMNTSDDEVPAIDENFRKKLLSRKSMDAICTASTGQKLDDKVAKWLSLKVKEKLENLLNEAGKLARRSRDSKIKVSHLQYAVRTDENLPANILFQLVPVGSNMPMPKKPSQRTRGIPLPAVEAVPPTNSHAISAGDPPAQVTPSIAGWLKKEQVLLKAYQRYPLTREQQCFYEMITENGVGVSESRRHRALYTMTLDPSVEVLLPRLSRFIADSTAVNIVQRNMPMLLYTMRMVRALLGNSRISLYKYLHLILPAVLSCLLARELSRGSEEHWALREYSGNIMAEIVRHFESTDSSILSRVVSIYKRALTMKPLTTVFGAVIGFGKMGNSAVRACIVPQIAYLAERIEPHLATTVDNTSSKLDKQASKYIRHRLVKVCTPVLKNLRSAPDVAEEYIAAYGSLGESLCHAVIVARIKDMTAKPTKSEGGAKVAKSKSSHSHKHSKGT
ncbi:hypothetical protein KR067_010243, partial [Drosophila pandora]